MVVIGGGFAGLPAAVGARGARRARHGPRGPPAPRRPRLVVPRRRDGRRWSTTASTRSWAATAARSRSSSASARGGKVHRQASLHVDLRAPAARRGRRSPARRWPSPLHLAGGLLRYRLLSRGERLRALRAGMRADGDAAAARSAARGLRRSTRCWRRSGSRRMRGASFWNPVAVATLNEAPERAAAGAVRRGAGAGVLPLAGGLAVRPRRASASSDLYTDDARRFIERRGGRVVDSRARRRRSRCATARCAASRCATAAGSPPTPASRPCRRAALAPLPAARPACAAGVRAARRGSRRRRS